MDGVRDLRDDQGLLAYAVWGEGPALVFMQDLFSKNQLLPILKKTVKEVLLQSVSTISGMFGHHTFESAFVVCVIT